MTAFPDDSTFPRSQDGTEPILGGSIGLNRILLMLRQTAPLATRLQWGAVLVNAFTVFRNIYNKELTGVELAVHFRHDIDLLRLYLDAYLTFRGPITHPIPLLVYAPTYRRVPSTILREPPPKAYAETDVAFSKFSHGFDKRPTLFGVSEGTALWSIEVGHSALPHIELATWLNRHALQEKDFGYRHGMPVMLISHCPIDLHIYRRIPQVFLVESYQGTIRPPREFGRKLSGGTELIPFTTATHRAFGDPFQIAPLIDSKQRKTLLALAETQKWPTLPHETVTRTISTTANLPITELLKYPL